MQEQLAGVWIHENAELAGITKAEVEVIKAFASPPGRPRQAGLRALPGRTAAALDRGRYHQPDRVPAVANRQPAVLADRGAGADRPKTLRESRLQLWGEAAHYQSQGEALTLPEALWADAGVEQEERRVQHPWEAKLAAMTVIGAENDRRAAGGTAAVT